MQPHSRAWNQPKAKTVPMHWLPRAIEYLDPLPIEGTRLDPETQMASRRAWFLHTRKSDGTGGQFIWRGPTTEGRQWE